MKTTFSTHHKSSRTAYALQEKLVTEKIKIYTILTQSSNTAPHPSRSKTV